MARNNAENNHEEMLRTTIQFDTHICSLVQRNVNEFFKLREELLTNTNIRRLAGFDDVLASLIDGPRIKQLNSRISSDKIHIALCGENSSGKTAFLHTFLGISKILPSGDGPVTARITKLTYAPGEQACICIRKALRDQTLAEDKVDLSAFFISEKPQWINVGRALSKHVKRPEDIDSASHEFAEWARCLVEIHIPSQTLCATEDMAKFNGSKPEICSGNVKSTTFSIFTGNWGDEKNLVVKKLSQPLTNQPMAAYYEAHYHRQLAKLCHPNIINLRYFYEHYLEDGTSELWMIFPPLTQSLAQFLPRCSTTLSIKTVLQWMNDIADVLITLHENALVHRNVVLSNILPSGIGPVTARIVQLTYAPAEQAFFRVYETIEKASVQCEGDLSHLFENQLQPDWAGVTDVIQPHVKRPSYIDEKSPEFNEWAKCFVEISLPSKVLALGIDIYDTPGFLSDNREQVLTDNLHKLVKRIKPTLVFLYENATISDTDKNCFLAMKNALGSMERVSVFFLNTKADCISIANDYYLDDDPENVTPDLFYDKLREKRQHCYDLLLRRREMANEVLGGLPKLVDECSCFDICTVPGDLDSWEEYSNLINTSSFQRLVEYAVKAYSAPTLTLARDILSTIDDYFDMTVSTSVRLPNQWKALRDEAIEWGRKFFDEYKEILPTLTNDLTTNILDLLERSKQEIVKQAALMIRNDDPIDRLLQDNRKTIIDYVRIAVQEQVIKTCLNREPEKRPTANNLVSELTHIQHMSELKLCMACDERARALRFVPCGHKVMCTQCWETWCRTSN
ncbi:unnamed protein product, partial [Rotaria sordida]